jgi:imidazolonepropionase-like amidohydrolase
MMQASADYLQFERKTMNRSRSRRNCLLVAGLFIPTILAGETVLADFQTPTAITNVTLVAPDGSKVENATILFDHGRIIAAGLTITLPAEAETIDGEGFFAYPGFIDASSYLGLPDEKSDKRTEAQRVRLEDEKLDPKQGPFAMTRDANRVGIMANWRAMDEYTPTVEKLAAHRAAGFTSALVVPHNRIISGTSDVFLLSDAPIRRVALATSVAMHASFTRGDDGLYPRSLLGIFAHFRQVMLDAKRHTLLKARAARSKKVEDRVPTDVVLDALQPLLTRNQPMFFEANSEREIRRAMGLADEFGFDIVITGAREAWKITDLLKDKNVPLVVSLKFDDEPEYGKKKKGGKKTDKSKPESDDAKAKEADKKKDEKTIYEPLKVRNERRRLWEEQVANAIRLHEAGIPFSLRTSDLKNPAELTKVLRTLIERGLPESAALAALTTNPAALLGISSDVGSLETGLLANITLTDKPFTEEKSKVKMTFVEGKKFIPKGDKKGAKSKSGKGEDNDEPASDQPDAEVDVSVDEPKTIASDEASPDEPTEDKGPTFASEIKADRFPKTKTGGNVLIEHATIIPVTSPTLKNASVLILNGKIVKIAGSIPAPDDIHRIDGTGLFIMPGIVDAHSHLGIDAGNEWPLAISAEVRIMDVINTTSAGIFRALAGGVTTHHAMHGSSNPIGGQNVTWKLKYDHPMSEILIPGASNTIKFALGENVTHANRSSRVRERFPISRMGVEAVIRTGFDAATKYRAKWDAYDRDKAAGQDDVPPRRDLRLEALAKILTGDLTVHSHCYRSDEILRLLQVAEDYGFRIQTLQHVLEGYRIAPEIARHGAGASTFASMWAYKVEAYGAIPFNAALMTAKGVNCSINSDSPNLIRYLAQEAAQSIKWGDMSENQTLRLITINPAMQLGIDTRVGSLEVGKDGDLAIFNGHPLNTFSKCVMTLIDGEVFFEHPSPAPSEPCSTFTPANPSGLVTPSSERGMYAIVGATVHPISRPAIEGGTVVIIDNKIHAVGMGVSIPPGTKVIDATGLHVYPGMIDAGSTLGLNEIGSVRATQDSRDIATFAPHLRTLSAVHPHSEHIAITRAAGTTTTLVAPSGSRIAGQSAVIHLDGWTAPQMSLVDTFGLHMTVPSLPVHLRGDDKRKKKAKEDHEKAVKELDDFMAKAKHYAKVTTLAESDQAITFETDLRLDAMLPYIRGEKPVVFNARNYKQILDTLEFVEKNDLKCILRGATQAWKLADTLAEKNIPVILGTPLSYPRGQFEPWDSIYKCAATLHKAGVKFCFASEEASSAYDLGRQVGMAVAHGLPRDVAERAVTLGAAEILGIADRVGSIEVGKLADLIVTTDTPLQTTSQVKNVFIAGRPIDLSNMHQRNYEKFRNRPDPDLPPIPDLVGPPSLTNR